jgi:hypothetical protein
VKPDGGQGTVGFKVILVRQFFNHESHPASAILFISSSFQIHFKMHAVRRLQASGCARGRMARSKKNLKILNITAILVYSLRFKPSPEMGRR